MVQFVVLLVVLLMFLQVWCGVSYYVLTIDGTSASPVIMNAKVCGAKGGDSTYGGRGGCITTSITYYIYVGCSGSGGQVCDGGCNGGGNGYYPGSCGGGGGASDIRTSIGDLTSRIVVGGGGGGGSRMFYGGHGGGLIGQNGGFGGASSAAGIGGTQSSGGSGSTYQCTTASGTLGVGGSALPCGNTGGGGGYYGGGGGYDGAGGGSSFSAGVILTNLQGANNGDGYVTIRLIYSSKIEQYHYTR